MSPARRAVIITTLALALAAGCSSHGASVTPPADRTIDVTMTDNAFAPTDLQVAAGETITFRFRNDGVARHEAVIGDQAAQDIHHEEMAAGTRSTDEDDGHGDDGHGGSNATTVEPGQTGEITMTFDDAGTVIVGCHEPGHWESGMRADVIVS